MKLPTNGRFKNIAGMKFGMLQVLAYAGSNSGHAFWKCKCDCGKETVTTGKLIRTGHTQSCGCLHEWIIRSGNNTRTHGHTANGKFSKEYASWNGAKSRCFRKKDAMFKNYGARGITMCGQWKKSFESFLKDMGNCPDGMTLDRINNDGNYEPGNCRWATRTEQNNNKRNNHRISFGGKAMTISEWATNIGINQKTIWKRITRGWPLERALSK